MNEAVDRVIVERGALDEGWPGSLVASALGHTMLVGGAFVLSVLAPREPPVKIMDGFVVQLPRGGGGPPATEAPAPAQAPPAQQAPPETSPPQPKAEPAKVVKPPKDERKTGLPELDARKGKKPKPEAPPPKPTTGATASKGAQPASIGIGPPGPGVPGGTDSGGDWYLATVQQKIWSVWMQEIKASFTEPIAVTFTILADGSLEGVEASQSSGVMLLDLAAKRAIYSAAPFGPLPKNYGTNRITIQAIFKPTP